MPGDSRAPVAHSPHPGKTPSSTGRFPHRRSISTAPLLAAAKGFATTADGAVFSGGARRERRRRTTRGTYLATWGMGSRCERGHCNLVNWNFVRGRGGHRYLALIPYSGPEPIGAFGKTDSVRFPRCSVRGRAPKARTRGLGEGAGDLSEVRAAGDHVSGTYYHKEFGRAAAGVGIGRTRAGGEIGSTCRLEADLGYANGITNNEEKSPGPSKKR